MQSSTALLYAVPRFYSPFSGQLTSSTFRRVLHFLVYSFQCSAINADSPQRMCSLRKRFSRASSTLEVNKAKKKAEKPDPHRKTDTCRVRAEQKIGKQARTGRGLNPNKASPHQSRPGEELVGTLSSSSS